MTKYANKTCYDCAVIKPANQMYRVTESYNSGRSDRRPDAANVAGFLFSDAKTSRNMIKGALTKNNRRSYTRNRTVWKCGSCSGHDAAVVREAEKSKQAEIRAMENARDHKVYVANGGFTGMVCRFINFLFMLMSGGMLAFGMVGLSLLGGTFLFTGEQDMLNGVYSGLIVIAVVAPVFALTLHNFRKPKRS